MRNIYFRSSLFILSCVMLLSSCAYFNLSKENVIVDGKLYLPTGCTYIQMLDSLKPWVRDFKSFEKALKAKPVKHIYPGRYSLHKDATNKSLIEELITGRQDEIQITVGNYSSIYELAQKLDPLLEISDTAIINAIAQRPEAQGLDTLQMIYFLSPNTYRFYWTVKADELVNKIAASYKKYWTEEKKALLSQSHFTEMEAITLASIVQMESYKPDEQPKVAGLYINRLKLGMKLDADPTVIFTKRITAGWDKKIQRVYNKDLLLPSLYNTYMHAGLPPGPVCMPNPSAINAVLEPEQSAYIYFVADPSRPGYHLYAKTLKEQEANAKIYREWLQKNNIR